MRSGGGERGGKPFARAKGEGGSGRGKQVTQRSGLLRPVTDSHQKNSQAVVVCEIIIIITIIIVVVVKGRIRK